MKNTDKSFNRRNFLKKSAQVSLGTGCLLALPQSSSWANSNSYSNNDQINIIGPKKGFSPQIGTLVSMMNWMRDTILYPVRGLSIAQLDYLHDENSNTIGAMLLHLAATERFYQIHTFEGKSWGDWSKADRDKWSVPSGLGDRGRKAIKGNDLNYYLDALKEVRENTLKEFAKRDDDWLMEVDHNWGWGPTNNYCKWFHVCEHESNHNGQIKWLKSRLPS